MFSARALWVIDAERCRTRYGTAGLCAWRLGRYLALYRTEAVVVTTRVEVKTA